METSIIETNNQQKEGNGTFSDGNVTKSTPNFGLKLEMYLKESVKICLSKFAYQWLEVNRPLFSNRRLKLLDKKTGYGFCDTKSVTTSQRHISYRIIGLNFLS